MLLDVSRVIPDESYLTALNGQITATTGTQAAGVPPTTAVSNLIGNVTFSGVARETAVFCVNDDLGANASSQPREARRIVPFYARSTAQGGRHARHAAPCLCA